MRSETSAPDRAPEQGSKLRWAGWLVGLACVSAVVAVGAHLTELDELVVMTRDAQWRWLAIAVALQMATYAAQGSIWRTVARTASTSLTARFAFELSVAELFVDQALPSAGASGTAFAARVLRAKGVAKAVVATGVVARAAAYYAGFALTLLVAVMVTWSAAPWGGSIIRSSTAIFALFSVALFAGCLLGAGRDLGTRWSGLQRFHTLREANDFLASASSQLVRSVRLLTITSTLQVVTVVLDAATVWALLRAVGALSTLSAAFVAFMTANVFRAVAISPGGLGAFEGVLVMTLHSAGISTGRALTATMLFRALSFWLPMIPGAILSRRLLKAAATAKH